MNYFIKAMIILVALISLSACSDAPRCDDENCASVRFKVIAQFEVDGQIKEFSNVMQVNYTGYEKASGLGYGGTSKTWGEAMVLDFGTRGRVYMLTASLNEQAMGFSEVYAPVLLQTFKIKASTGSLKKKHIAELKTVAGRHKLETLFVFSANNSNDLVPAFVGFRDEKNPNSIFTIGKDEFPKHFKDAIRFRSLDVEITDEPITSGIVTDYLTWLEPWLSDRTIAPFEILTGTSIPPRRDWELRWIMHPSFFFTKGNR